MDFKLIISEVLDENSYILFDKNKDCVIIDPGFGVEKQIIEYIEKNSLNLKAILLTHGHFDHILGIEKIQEYKRIPIYIGKEDINFLYDSKYSLSNWISIDFKLSEKYDIIGINGNENIFGLECIKTPGHTKGSVCYVDSVKKNIFTGDTMFKMTYGRTDFPTGNYDKMLLSLKKLLSYNDYTVYPGHGPSTTTEKEKRTYLGMI